MADAIIEATERAIANTVADFQDKPGRYWNERDLHWILYPRLREVFPDNNPLELIRAEFPTIKKYPARGQYDLTVLDPHSYCSENVQKLPMDADWDEFLSKLPVLVAIEMKLWHGKTDDEAINRDIQKLTDTENRVVYPYFLNFVQLDFGKRAMKEYYMELRQRIACLASRCTTVRVLCVPNKIVTQSGVSNWLSTLH